MAVLHLHPATFGDPAACEVTGLVTAPEATNPPQAMKEVNVADSRLTAPTGPAIAGAALFEMADPSPEMVRIRIRYERYPVNNGKWIESRTDRYEALAAAADASTVYGWKPVERVDKLIHWNPCVGDDAVEEADIKQRSAKGLRELADVYIAILADKVRRSST